MADVGGNNNDAVFVYMGGNQRVPRDATHVRVHQSVKIISRSAFSGCENLVSIEMHDGVEIIGKYSFFCCYYLRQIKLLGVRVIEEQAFWHCEAMTGVEFGNKLDTIGEGAFGGCKSLQSVEIPKVRIIARRAFGDCERLTGADLSEDLRHLGSCAFERCPLLKRIAVSLKHDIIADRYVFDSCTNLSQIDLVGGIHKAISSLHLESWRNAMNDTLNQINLDLDAIPDNEKTLTIDQWIHRVLRRIERYKRKHCTLLKEAMTLLELALWKATLDESQDEWKWKATLDEIDETEEGEIVEQPSKKVKVDVKTEHARRQEHRITSGANIVVKNVLPFLKLE